MKTCLFVFVFILIATFAYADYVSPAIDFFMHGRQYETFLRDHYRFDESKPLRIEYSYMKWRNSHSLSSEYSDYLSMEITLPTYKSQRLSIDIPVELFGNKTYEIELVSCLNNIGWILPIDNEVKFKFEFFKDVNLNPYPYSDNTTAGILAPTLEWEINYE